MSQGTPTHGQNNSGEKLEVSHVLISNLLGWVGLRAVGLLPSLRCRPDEDTAEGAFGLL